jgi:putative membrane-bound dehydrogenase-like protein
MHMKRLLTLALILLPSLPLPAAEVTVNNRHFTVPDGFTVELAAGPPLVQRPITADFDEQGRLYVADSSGSGDKPAQQLKDKPHRIVRLIDTKGDGTFDRQTVFADHMMFPEGTLWLDGSLYVAAPPSIWKLTDTTGTLRQAQAYAGVADERIEWFNGKTVTGCANDLHGPYLGPDGWVYWCKGAFAEQTYERAGRKPFITKAAHVFRARPDGSGIEPVMSGGMDNPVEIAFTPGGECIVSSTFLINPAGGKRDGLIHAVYGGIYPKIHDDATDPLPHTFPDLLPPLTHTGPAAECALTRYEGNAFGPDYEDNLFASSFNLHKVTRHVLTPDGATFKTTDSDFLVSDDFDFHPTHLIEDADGSLLVVDTGGWYKLCCPTSQLGKPDILGAIYRVRRIDAKPVQDPRGLKLQWDSLSPGELCGLLGDSRFAVRRRATALFGKRGPDAVAALSAMLAKGSSPGVRLGAAWAASRIDNEAAASIDRGLLKDPEETVRQAAAHAVSVRRDRQAVPELLELLKNSSIQNRRVAAEALGRIGEKAAMAPLLEALAQPVDQFLEHSLTYALIEIADGQGTTAGLASANPRVRRACLMALDQMDPRGRLGPEAVAREMSSPDGPLRATAEWIASRHPEWGDTLAETFNRRLRDERLGATEADGLSHQLAKLAGSQAVQKVMSDQLVRDGPQRQIVLAAIGLSNLKALPASWVSGLASALNDPVMVSPTAAALRKLPAGSIAPLADALLATGKRPDLAPDARLDALSAVPSINEMPADVFAFLISQLTPDVPAPRRSLAADVISRASLSTEQLMVLTESLRSAGPLEINKLLHAFAKTRDEAVGLKLVAALREAPSLRSLRPDLLKSHLGQFGPKVERESQDLLLKLNPDLAEQKTKLDQLLASLPNGNIRRGQAVFNSAKTSCIRCHAIGYVGGRVGPDLTSVGQIRSPRDILESIVFPSASFVQGFEPYTATTNSGERYDGLLRRDDSDGILLVTGPDQEVKIPRSDVKELRPGIVSVMPAGLDQQLSPQELADLVAFLKAAKR